MIFSNSNTVREDQYDEEQNPTPSKRNLVPKSILKRDSIKLPYLITNGSPIQNMDLPIINQNAKISKANSNCVEDKSIDISNREENREISLYYERNIDNLPNQVNSINSGEKNNNFANRVNRVTSIYADDRSVNLPKNSAYSIDIRTNSVQLNQPSHAEWQWDQFFEFFFYHALFYFLLGPFTCLLLSRSPGITLMKNLRFYPSVNTTFFARQTLIWLGSVIGGLYYFIQNDTMITFTEIVFMWFAILQKALVVSAKYATFTQEMINSYKTEVQTNETFFSHMMLTQWKIQPIELIYNETKKSFRRHQQDQSKFHFQFLVQPNIETINTLSKMAPKGFDVIDIYQSTTENNVNFDGNRIISYFITQFQLNQPIGRMLSLNLFTVFVLSVTPLLLKIMALIKNPVSILDFCRLILNAAVTFTTFSGSFIFLTLGIIDLERKLHLLKQCSLMISTAKQQNQKKLVPTINLHNPQTIQAWSLLRSTCFDYGYTYNLRTQGFYSIIFLASIIIYILALGLTLEMLKFDQFQLILLLEVAIILIKNTTQYLILGAGINDYFDIFDSQLEDIKTLYLDTSTAKYEYFASNTEPQNLLHKKFVSHIKKNTQNIDEVEDYLEIVIRAIENCQRILRYDKRNNSFQLYGVTITYNLLKSVLVALATVVGYAIQQRFKTTATV